MTARTDTHDKCFSAADILLPRERFLQRWAVIACDQFTSEPEYWNEVERLTGEVPSSFQLILPESELHRNPDARIRKIHGTMLRYLEEQIFREYPDSFIYTERTLANGAIRRGLIGKIDLEAYEYTEHSGSLIRATERTVQERIPPRMAVRKGAALELPHILLLCDDERCQVIEPFQVMRDRLPKLYDFDLMLGGGHISGWLVSGSEKHALEERLEEYERREIAKHPDNRLLYAVGDGNHSLATAKACLEEWKRQNPEEDTLLKPQRYALCELNNIHDPGQTFEPIHRVVKACRANQLLSDLCRHFRDSDGTAISWISGEREGSIRISSDDGTLPLAVLQDWLDSWLNNHEGEIDYIHGEESLRMLGRGNDTVAFCLPPLDKRKLFQSILTEGVLPRKTFSMGTAKDKRYYIEARKILP